MTAGLYESILRRPRALGMAAVALTVIGGISAMHLPLDLIPAVEFPRCSVVTLWNGRTPEQVERSVTAPVEAMAQTIRGIRSVNSASEDGLSVVEIEFDGRRQPSAVRSELRDRLRDPGLLLPPDAGPPRVEEYVPPAVRDVRGFMVYVLSSGGSVEETGRIAYERVAPALRSVPGVSAVEVLGVPRRIRRVQVRRSAMRSLGLATAAVGQALRSAMADSSFPVRARGGAVWSVSSGLKMSGAGDPRSAPLARTPGGSPLNVASVAEMVDTVITPDIDVRLRGQPAVTLQIDREVGTNALTVARAVRRCVADLQLPPSVRPYLQVDRTRGIELEVARMQSHAVAAFAAVALLLALSLRSSVQAIVILAVPVVSLGATLLILAAAHVGLHLFSMAGLVLGMGRLVDDAVVVVHHLQWRVGSGLQTETVARAMPPIALPVCASTAVAVGALSGSVAAPDELRPLLMDFAVAAGASLTVSCIAALTLVPAMLCALSERGRLPMVRTGRAMWYARVLRTCLRHPKVIGASTVLLFGIPLWMIPDRVAGTSGTAQRLNAILEHGIVRQVRTLVEPAVGGATYLFTRKTKFRDLMEQQETSRLVFWASFPPGTPHETCRSVALKAERTVLALLPRDQNLLVQIAPGFCVLAVEFDEPAAATALPHVIRGQLVAHAAALSVGTVAVSGFGPGYSAGFEGGATFTVRVAGYRYDTVRSIASSLGARFRAHPRMAAVDIDRSGALHEGMYEVTSTLDHQRLARSGVSVSGLAEAINEGKSGILVTGPREDGREAPPFVVLEGGADAPTLFDVEGTMLRGARGASGRLSEFMRLGVKRTPARIIRERQQYVRWLTLDYKGTEKDGARVVDGMLRTSMIPPGYSAERHDGRGALAGEGVEPALVIGGVSLLVSWMIAAAAYESLALPALVLLTAPFSLIGIFVAHPLAGLAFGRGGVVAAILLVGIVGANAVVLVDRLRPMQPGGPPTHARIIDGARERLQPVLVTAGATFAGVIPLLVMEPVGSVGFGFGFALSAGLVSGTLLTLLVVPVAMAAVTHARPSP